MSLFLVEASLQDIVKTKEQLTKKVEELEVKLKNNESSLIELQVSTDFTRSFFIIEAIDEQSTLEHLNDVGIIANLVKEVRLVGDELDNVKANKDKVNYLVEWNLPEDLTMEKYLERKKQNSVYYDEVPEVSFARTYVCEDMTKCLCFYDAPDETAVTRAREAVKAPIDEITEILDKE
ncbi:DUF4242 domain-containing protein [Pueribacillus sp. YX66]|uniref:DUF4242 domain-containing protein n=1 Tax=Pueribacillus sp. YX66 TaxID=3229242 RepID=UPI00358D590E